PTVEGIAIGILSRQLTAFFTSASILASSAAVNSFSAKAVGHTVAVLCTRLRIGLGPSSDAKTLHPHGRSAGRRPGLVSRIARLRHARAAQDPTRQGRD